MIEARNIVQYSEMVTIVLVKKDSVVQSGVDILKKMPKEAHQKCPLQMDALSA